VAPGLQTRWLRVWAVRVLRCTGAGQEYPEISPESPDFPETPGKSPEYLGLADKIVLSGDFQDSPIHPPSRRHQDPFTEAARVPGQDGDSSRGVSNGKL
jgi:hypothetical protein